MDLDNFDLNDIGHTAVAMVVWVGLILIVGGVV